MPPTPLNLKQRLTALSLAPSSPSSPLGADGFPRSTLSPKRKKFALNWGKRNATDPALNEEQQALDRVQDVMSKLIFQAGVDFETRPMVVFNASALPDPREVSYDLLLSRILSYLNLYVESDYSIVFFAAGSRHTPAWNWVWKAYRSLSRKYRKNLKQLYIVHSSFFSKMLFSVAGAIISPKFFRKLTYVKTLSDLAYQVPITQIDIAPAVYQENLKHENHITLPTPTRSNVFGVPLEEIMGTNAEKGGIPRVVRDCIQYLRETSLDEEGLFRRSANSVMLKQVKDAYDRGHVVSLETFNDSHLAAVLLKKYLRDLPTPLFTEDLYPIIRRCPIPSSDPNDMSGVMYIKGTILPELALCSYVLLSHILQLMHEITLRESENRMNAHNLAIVLCPNLLASKNPARDVIMCALPPEPMPGTSSPVHVRPTPTNSEGRGTLGLVIKLCIQRYYEVFDEIIDRGEALPPEPRRPFSETSSALSAPVSRSGPANEEEDDIDDGMLVMPIGPSQGSNQTSAPSAWNTNNLGSTSKSQRHRPTQSGNVSKSNSGVQSSHTVLRENANSGGFTLTRKARSLISIEKARPAGTVGKKGAITIGKGTSRKSIGSAVEALGVTAAGFFTPPSANSPVPTQPRASESTRFLPSTNL